MLLLALALPDTVLSTVATTQAEGSGYEVNVLASTLVSILVHTDDQGQFVLCGKNYLFP